MHSYRGKICFGAVVKSIKSLMSNITTCYLTFAENFLLLET